MLHRARESSGRAYRPLALSIAITAFLLATGCTDPTSAGEAPFIIGLSDTDGTYFGAAQRRVLPSDSCPTPLVSRGDVVRRGIPGSGATIAFPATMSVSSAAFSGNQGVVFSIAGSGIIGVTYDRQIVSYSRAVLPGRRGSSLIQEAYEQSCRVSAGTREGMLLVTWIDLGVSNPFFPLLFAPDFLLRVQAPDGRAVNIRVSDSDYIRGSFSTDSVARRLLGIASSIAW